MDCMRKEVKHHIHAYFTESSVKHTVKVCRYHQYQMIDVEYEDFFCEARVMDDLRAMVGPDFLINVKRECSDEMLMEIHLYHMTNCDKSKRPKTIYAAKEAVLNLIPVYEHSWMKAM